MTDLSTTDAIIEAPMTDTSSFVDWPAIIAGIVLASAISLVLLTFGSATGLNLATFDAADDVAPVWVAVAAASWLLWVQVSSFMAGGYLTGRLRKRHAGATEHEVDVRDGAHGLLVWGGALVVGAVLAVGGLSAIANSLGSATATLTGSAASFADVAGEPEGYFVDSLFRSPPQGAEVDTAAAPDASPPPSAPDAGSEAVPPAAPVLRAANTGPADANARRDEVGRILARSAATGVLDAADRTYLGQLVVESTGLGTAEARARVDEVLAALDGARAEAARLAESARRTGVVAAFIAAASFLVSAAGAFWAAQMGGNHRDRNTAFDGIFRRNT